jgi:ABC-2 type transport system ATP-binding protein
MSYSIKIDSLSKTFKGKKRSYVEALKELTLSVAQGEVFGFLGPNGAGKSTTIKILMGLIFPTSGTASLLGNSVSLPESRKRLGYLPENPSLYDFLTAREYLDFIGRSFDMDSAVIASRTAEVLDMLQLSDAADRPVRSYSKGMVQRLGLAQALLHDPDLYILDEPMSGLDPIGRSLVKDIIRKLKEQGKTVFFSTHITADVEAVCDRVGIIAKGKLEALDTVENIMRSGILGYTVQVSGTADLSVGGCTLSEAKGALYEYDVPKDGFNDFIATVASKGGKVELIETKRKDLEEFFLEIVKRKDAPA